jgi:hypothetical protein
MALGGVKGGGDLVAQEGLGPKGAYLARPRAGEANELSNEGQIGFGRRRVQIGVRLVFVVKRA